jgi:putative phage-type endonuclease
VAVITSDLFLASKDLDESAWFIARRTGITATQVAKAATSSGFAEMVQTYWDTEGIPDNPYMKFGRDAETWISLWVKDNYGIMPNSWLIKSPEGPYMATPDGLSIGHETIAEIKTTGKDWGTKIPIAYQRQVQWQLYVTGASSCVFAYVVRKEVDTPAGPLFVPASFEPTVIMVEPDLEMIEKLKEVADKLWVAVNDEVE